MGAMEKKIIKIAPSILSADFSRLSEQLASVEEGGADLLHVDVMDGHFVPNITFGPIIVSAVRKLTELPLCVHLMITEPWHYVSAFCEAGADYLTFHREAFPGVSGSRSEAGSVGADPEKPGAEAAEGSVRGVSPGTTIGDSAEVAEGSELIRSTIAATKEKNVRPGLAINPGTAVSDIAPFLDMIDIVIVMSVHPGFGGQGFIPGVLSKIQELSRHRETRGFEIEVDGGVNLETAPSIANAGATILAAGSYVFCSPAPALAVRNLRRVALGPRGG
jgi:ribulose-phosphate 3-epimerase